MSETDNRRAYKRRSTISKVKYRNSDISVLELSSIFDYLRIEVSNI